MITFSYRSANGPRYLVATSDEFVEAGIEPAFASDEELERQFAELRLTYSND